MLICQCVEGGALQAVVLGIVVGLAEDDYLRAAGAVEHFLGWNKGAGPRVPDTAGERRLLPMGAAEQRGGGDGSGQRFRC